MAQPIPKRILEKNLEVIDKGTYTLLIDGNSLLEVAFHADKTTNKHGEHVGGTFQFLLQMKILLSKRDFDYVYVFWDGDNSGELRYAIYPEYKANRDKKYNDDVIDSDYYKQIDKFVKNVLVKRNRETPIEKLNEKELFHRQRNRLQKYLEELFVRQVMVDKIEGDDLIAYYCNNKKESDKIYIVSGDRDLTQLLGNNICLYVLVLKEFVTAENHKKILGIPHKNVLLKKIICGDASDNIKGIKGVGEKTLLTLFPEISEREVKLHEVVERCKILNDDRVKEKKKPLKSYDNIINQISDGLHSGNVFEINDKIINLQNPLLSKEAIDELDNMMYVPIDSEGRSMTNLYGLVCEDGIEDIIDERRFSSFFSTFNKTINKERDFLKKWIKGNT